ncbi:MAG: sulfurtransferase TusA family protein [Moraxella sp.]|nr:sulfurtransferase TusA family protein [Moraxella sp.]
MHSQIFLGNALTEKAPLIDGLIKNKPEDLVFSPFVFIDGRGLACPMPLLKLKLSLKTLTHGSVYVVATDSHAVVDIGRFCEKNALTLTHWQDETADAQSHTPVTLFHLYVTKTQ